MTQKPMTKSQLVAALAETAGLDKTAASRALDALVAIVTREVAVGGAVTLPGLGKFACRDRPEREVRNPATGEKMTKPADRSAKVTIAKQRMELSTRRVIFGRDNNRLWDEPEGSRDVLLRTVLSTQLSRACSRP